MKKIIALALAIVMVMSLSASAMAADTLKLVFPEINADNGLVCDMLRRFADNVKEGSNGRIEIDVFGGGQLGTEGDTIEMMRTGVAHIIRINPANLANRGISIPEYTAMGLPFLVQSIDGGLEFFYGEHGRALADKIVENSNGEFHSLYNYILTPARNMFTKKLVTSLGDFAKLKIRSETSEVKVDMINSWASATPLAMSEIYTSLQTGVLDGCENTLAGYYDNAWFEQVPYVLETEHVVGASVFMISDIAWQAMSEDEQKMMIDALKEACDWFQAQQLEQLVDYRAKLTEKGVTFTPCTDRQAWIDSCKPLYEKYAVGLDDFITTIQSFK